ncbi:MAG TPA: DUF1570 domain-containing protein [Lacipirellulaceae bacterium]|jgi:hypothetical protein|nr:DUF1570 domain-containing protein [Lacipirellulaceae bacterium]
MRPPSLTSWLGRFLFAAATLAPTTVFAQTGTPQPPVPTPNTQQFRLALPADSRPIAAHDERLIIEPPFGAPQVVQLYCRIEPYALVMLPTGELSLIELSKAKPTTEPFVPDTQEQLVETLKRTGYSKYKFEQGNFYLYAYDCSDEFFARAKSILESMLPGVVKDLKSWGLTVNRPQVPLVVLIVPNRAAYDAIHPMPPEVLAYYSMLTNQIVMYEDKQLGDAAPELAAKQACYTIAHEGVHQLLANIGVQKRLAHWPAWICEGLPEYYCPLKVNSTLVHSANAELPTRTVKWTKAGMVNDIRMWSLLQMHEESGKAIETLVESPQIDANGYALAWGLVHYLAKKKPAAFREYLADISKYEPLDPANRPHVGQADPCFAKHFGNDYAALEKDLQQYLTSPTMQKDYLDPIENQTHYLVKSVEKQGHSFAIKFAITTSPDAAKKWKEQEEATNKKASFFTIVCKTRGEAERQIQKMQR